MNALFGTCIELRRDCTLALQSRTAGFFDPTEIAKYRSMGVVNSMSREVGRNALCPCGSGRKYKHCCLGKEEVANPVSTSDTLESSLSVLVEADDAFKSFFEAVKPLLPERLRLVQDRDLPRGVDFRSTRASGGVASIRLRRYPPVPRNCTRIAHELAHFVLDARRYPGLGWRERGTESLASAISSMLHDPLVLAMLLEHGLDPSSDFRREIRETKRALGGIRKSPKDKLGRLHWAVNRYGLELEAGVLVEAVEAVNAEFVDWYDARYPDMIGDIAHVRQLVSEFGFETPEDTQHTLERIVEAYDLQGLFGIGCP